MRLTVDYLTFKALKNKYLKNKDTVFIGLDNNDTTSTEDGLHPKLISRHRRPDAASQPFRCGALW
jgi:hypothetical protein